MKNYVRIFSDFLSRGFSKSSVPEYFVWISVDASMIIFICVFHSLQNVELLSLNHIGLNMHSLQTCIEYYHSKVIKLKLDIALMYRLWSYLLWPQLDSAPTQASSVVVFFFEWLLYTILLILYIFYKYQIKYTITYNYYFIRQYW